MFRPIAEQKRLQFRIEVVPDSPASIQTDRLRLEQILKNLLSNACKFTEEGQVSLTVSKAGEGRICFAVRDTGIGIPEGDQQMVFGAFRQADSKTSRKYGGTGLGLSISRELTRLLGGTLTVSSEPGRGSLFQLTIPECLEQAQPSPKFVTPVPTNKWSEMITDERPAADPVAKIRESLQTRSSIGGEPVPRTDKRQLLIIEDDLIFREIVEEIARDLKFTSIVAKPQKMDFDLRFNPPRAP